MADRDRAVPRPPPHYRRMVGTGFLRRLVPQASGGDGSGASTTATPAEELVVGDLGVAPVR